MCVRDVVWVSCQLCQCDSFPNVIWKNIIIWKFLMIFLLQEFVIWTICVWFSSRGKGQTLNLISIDQCDMQLFCWEAKKNGIISTSYWDCAVLIRTFFFADSSWTKSRQFQWGWGWDLPGKSSMSGSWLQSRLFSLWPPVLRLWEVGSRNLWTLRVNSTSEFAMSAAAWFNREKKLRCSSLPQWGVTGEVVGRGPHKGKGHLLRDWGLRYGMEHQNEALV